MVSSVEGSFIIVKLELWNVDSPMAVTPSGIARDCTAQPEKAEEPISFSVEGNVNEESLLQPQKVPCPVVSMPSDSTTVVRS